MRGGTQEPPKHNKRVVEGDALDRIAAALERIAAALENAPVAASFEEDSGGTQEPPQ